MRTAWLSMTIVLAGLLVLLALESSPEPKHNVFAAEVFAAAPVSLDAHLSAGWRRTTAGVWGVWATGELVGENAAAGWAATATSSGRGPEVGCAGAGTSAATRASSPPPEPDRDESVRGRGHARVGAVREAGRSRRLAP